MKQFKIYQDAGESDLGIFKELLSDARFRIRLDDDFNRAIRVALTQMSVEHFSLDSPQVKGDDFAARLLAYEETVWPLQVRATLLGRWATFEQISTLTNVLERLSDTITDTQNGTIAWLQLRLYPLSLLLYSVGIASLASENYGAFAAAHTTRMNTRSRRDTSSAGSVLIHVVNAMSEMASSNVWRLLEDYKQKRVPESEYLFKNLQPVLDDLLFLGGSYERLFDRYEILRALIYADVTDRNWGPVGRFGWKYCNGGADNPFIELCSEASREKNNWGPIRAGLFGSSYARFDETASKFKQGLLDKLGWY